MGSGTLKRFALDQRDSLPGCRTRPLGATFARRRNVQVVDPLLLPRIAIAIPPVSVSVRRDVVYSIVQDRALTLNLFLPERAEATVLIVHGEPVLEDGTCFWSEDRRIKDTGPLESWANLLASRGIAVGVINRRSSCGFQHPHLVDEDLDAAVAHLGTLGAPVGRIAAFGFSAGTPFVIALARRDRRVKAVATMYGPLDMDEDDVVASFVAAQHAVTQRWNPLHQGPLEIPHLHVWPRNDWIPNGAKAFSTSAKRERRPFRLLEHPHGRHGFDFLDRDQTTAAIIEEVATFLTRTVLEDPPDQAHLF